jgi:NTE family protein
MSGYPMPASFCGSDPRIALALGGGSARGLAHIVVLEALDELGVKPVVIAGTSMGAICGACYAAGLPAADIRARFEDQFASRAGFLRHFAGKLRGGLSTLWSLRHPGIIDNVTLFEMLLPEVLHNDFSSLKIPFLAIAADFYAIEQVILDHGPLIPALAASCALPSMARPVILEGRVLIDGGYVNPVPYDVIMDRNALTVAVDVTGDTRRRPGVRVPGTLEAVTGATQLLFHSITREKLKSIAPDILIRPNVGNFAALDYFKIGEILAAAQTAKEDLKRQLSQRFEALA